MTEALFAALEARANSRGVALASEADLVDELGANPAVLQKALNELRDSGRIALLSPLPFLVVKLQKWSGIKPSHPKTAARTAARVARAYSFQSSLSQSKLLNECYRGPDDEEALLREILETLGENDPTTFRGALRRYAPDVIRTTLDRVRRMPTVRKSRTAVFRFLLPRIAKEPPSTN